MKVLLITAAGLSSRFSKSLGDGRKCLKCIYYDNSPKESLLYKMLCLSEEFDKYIIVGGYLYEELKTFVNLYLGDFRDKLVLVENTAYQEYGSGYSLYLGLKEAISLDCDELVFAEGDLYVDEQSFHRVAAAKNNVITINRESIVAEKAVAFYYDIRKRIHYIYDTSHSMLEVKEPFLGIFNSGQIWKFYDKEHLYASFYAVRKQDWQGTNLVFIQKYFENIDDKNYELVAFQKWINCNTISDFLAVQDGEC